VTRPLGPTVAALTLVVLAAACTDDAASAPTTSDVTVTVVDDRSTPDGQLRIGVVLPLTGTGSQLGTSMLDAIERAESEIAGLGVNEREVDVVVIDEATLGGAIPPVDLLFPTEVDAVIGPASSLLAERLVPALVDQEVLTCSPTASTMALDEFPDTRPLFIRTIPSDSMQARALARQLDSTGTAIVLAYVGDAYGERYAEAVGRELATRGAPSPTLVRFDPAEPDYSGVATRIVATGAPTIGIVGDPEAGPRLVQSLAEVLDPDVQTSIWMNDSMRVPSTGNTYRRLPEEVLAIMRGVSPRSSVDGSTTSSNLDGWRLFAANAYDCFNVIALAAEQAPSIDGRSMAELVVPTTSGGTPCSTYRSCIEQLRAGRGIDYDGPTGELQIERDGDPGVGLFDTYRFEDGLDVTDRTTAVRVLR
jgi:branched-chain amino acid transport system substrate-binding protein